MDNNKAVSMLLCQVLRGCGWILHSKNGGVTYRHPKENDFLISVDNESLGFITPISNSVIDLEYIDVNITNSKDKEVEIIVTTGNEESGIHSTYRLGKLVGVKEDA